MTQHLTLPIRAERSPLLPHTHSFVTEVGADLRPQRQRMMKIRADQQCLTDQFSNCDLEQLGVHVERVTVGDGRNGKDGSILTNMQVVGDGLFAQRIQPSTDVSNAVSDQNAFQPSRQLIQGFDVPYVDICEIHSGQDERAAIRACTSGRRNGGTV